MGNEGKEAKRCWLTVRASDAAPGAGYRWERTVEWAFLGKANSTVRTSRWQQVQKGQGFDFTVQAFGIQQRGEQQCLYWQIPNIKAR
ncbi:MAG: hypothetical protein RLZZ403_1917 [Pseudomonadota bacterium]